LNLTTIHRLRVVLGLLLLCLLQFACDEPNVIISVDDHVPPNFSFKGNGSIPFFVVFELPSDFRSPEDMKSAKVIWELRPKDNSHAQVPVGPITYGSIPEGFNQIIPSEGPPRTLEEGKLYQAGGPPIEMPRGYLRFTVQNGKVALFGTK
jgi:hypothetical protein